MRDRRSGQERRNPIIRSIIAQKHEEMSGANMDKKDISRELNLSIDVINRLEVSCKEDILV